MNARPRPSKLDPFKDEIHALLRPDPNLPGVRVRELIEPPGFAGSKTIVDATSVASPRPRTITALEHARALPERRGEPDPEPGTSKTGYQTKVNDGTVKPIGVSWGSGQVVAFDGVNVTL